VNVKIGTLAAAEKGREESTGRYIGDAALRRGRGGGVGSFGL